MGDPVHTGTHVSAANGSISQHAVSDKDENKLLDVEALPEDTVQLHQGNVKTPSNSFICDVETCLEEFTSRSSLRRHSKTHEEDKPFKCDQCSYSFNIEYNLTLHKAVHRSGKLECPDCSKKFTRLASFKAHIMIHEEEESLICVECGDEFNYQRELNIHRKSHDLQVTREEANHPNKEYIQKPRKTEERRGRKRSRRKTKNVCNLCKKTFQKPGQLIRHIRIHTGEKPFKCELCDKAFNQKGAVKIHMKTHTKEKHYHCDKCKLSFSQPGNLKSHYIRCHELNFQEENTFRCEECDSAFRSMGKLNLHTAQLHSSPQDTLAFLRIGALQLQKQFLEKRNERSTEGTSTVERPMQIDQATDTSNRSVENEIENHSNQAIDDMIQQLLTRTESNSKEKGTGNTTNSKNFSANILQQALKKCGLVAGQVTVEATISREGGSVEDVIQAFTTILHKRRVLYRTHTCQLCQKEFRRPFQLRRHLESHVRKGYISEEDANTLLNLESTGQTKQVQGEGEKAKNESNTQAKTTEEIIQKFATFVPRKKVHTCQLCPKKFTKSSDLQRHFRIHTQEKPFKCDVCQKSFAVKSTLKSHLRVHSGLKDYQCNVCKKFYSSGSSLRLHFRLHTGERPYECGFCPQKFVTSDQRNRHFMIHARKSNEKRAKPTDQQLKAISLPEPILITDRGPVQTPSQSNALTAQLENSQQEETLIDRPYKCGFCEKAFKKYSDLKQHNRSHTGERPYRCNQCTKSFMSSGALSGHRNVHSGVKAFKCEICDNTFTRRSGLKRHMDTHSDIRPFMCPCCQKTFKILRNCKKHMKSHKRKIFEGKEIIK